MKDPRKEKIRNLKKQIVAEQDALVETLKSGPSAEEIMSMPEEEAKAKRKALQDEIAKKRGAIHSMKEELNLVRLNKYSSSFFEFSATPPNRRLRRLARKMKRV